MARKFTQEETDLIARTMMQGASRDDVLTFVTTCERTGLDPFTRQIMPSIRRNRQQDGSFRTTWTWLVTIDGLRKIAVDSGQYEGQEGPFWCGSDGVWKEIWTDPKNQPFASKVIVHRKGFRLGLSGIAKYESYVQKTKEGKPNQVWSNLGDHMTAKCAEALALRKAFPNEMAGLYTDEEMESVTDAPASEATKPTPEAPQKTGPYAHPWSIDELEEFQTTMDRGYVAFKTAGAADKFEKFQDNWKANQKKDPAEFVLTKFADAVNKLEAAAKASMGAAAAAQKAQGESLPSAS